MRGVLGGQMLARGLRVMHGGVVHVERDCATGANARPNYR
jgi:hypothetical protein